MDYQEFLKSKQIKRKLEGFKPIWLPDCLFGFQNYLDDWIIRLGRGAIYADCGLGKSLMELVYAENVLRKTNKNVLILTPLAVAPQMVREGEKFGIEVKRSRNGKVHKGINVTNYQQLKHYNPDDFTCVIGDEGGCIKNFDGKTRKEVTSFMRNIPYRLLATATPAPNDYMELGTHSEALGVMPRNQMLGMFFTNQGDSTQQWVLKGHAKKRFWQWVASWSRAIRKPSDLGFSDDGFQLPELHITAHKIPSQVRTSRFLPKLARSLSEQRKEKKETVTKRCEKVAEILKGKSPSLVWCQLNREGDLLTELLDAVQVKGSDPDEYKEEVLNDFSLGKIKTLVTKPSIAGWGLNWQVCNQMSYFPTHSHEQFYQSIRRCWRFGQIREVHCHVVYSEAEHLVYSNMIRKERQSEEMYAGICREMNNVETRKQETNGTLDVEIPIWLNR